MDELLNFVIEWIFQKHGIDVTVMDFTKEENAFVDYFVLCTGLSAIQTKAIADNITDNLKKQDYREYHVEGYDNASWILIDIGGIIVHIFLPDTRSYYGIENLWTNIPTKRIEDDRKD